MPTEIIINEIHPNQEDGSEWIEFSFIGDSADGLDLNNYTIFDNSKQIYKFSTEQFTDKLLVIELSGLNNDNDSVILKDNNGEIIDSFTYTKTQKGLSWSRNEAGDFILGEASKNQINPSPTQAPSPTSPVPSPSSSLSPKPSQAFSTITPTLNPSQSQINTNKTTDNQLIENNKQETLDLREPYVYDLSKIKLEATESSLAKRNNRLVILSQTEGQRHFLNAIIGSSLIILSAIFLIYVKSKNKNH